MYYLGIDGGGTKTAFLLTDREGNEKASFTGPSCHYMQCGLDGLTEIIGEGVREVLKKAGGTAGDIENAFFGCAGYGDVESDMAVIKDAVKKAMADIPFVIGNDCENAHAGALNGEEGINIIAGTGSMAYGENKKTGLKLRCGGWHHLIGSDEGSGFFIAWHILKEFTRQSDGRDEKTLLYEAVKKRLDIKDDDGEVITRVVDEWEFDRTKVASLSTLISELFDTGDPHAERIIGLAASELFEMASTLKRRLSLKADGGVRVSGTGGVFNLKDRIIRPLSELLARDDMIFIPPATDPAHGAVILARR